MNAARNIVPTAESSESGQPSASAVERLTEFVMFAQRSFILDLSSELAVGNLSFAQFFLLGRLGNEDRVSLSDISEKMGLSMTAAVGLVDRLERLGYAEWTESTESRIQGSVKISGKGIELLERLRNIVANSIRKVLADSGETSEETKPSGRTESALIETINRGLPGAFWERFHHFKDRAESGDLAREESEELTRMADRIEEADAERWEAVVELSRLRGVPFEEVLAEFEIESALA